MILETWCTCACTCTLQVLKNSLINQTIFSHNIVHAQKKYIHGLNLGLNLQHSLWQGCDTFHFEQKYHMLADKVNTSTEPIE